MTADRARAARDLLAFYLEAGIAALVEETPVDRLTAAVANPDSPPSPVRKTKPELAPATTPRVPASTQHIDIPAPDVSRARSALALETSETAVMAAREAARRAASLDELAEILARFDGCALKATATKLVFADGNPAARVMFVGEAPGAEEDREGLPFVGRSGRLLDQMMAAIGLTRQSAYVANIIPWRPPGNRTPTPLESQICLPFILRQIELADPDVLVCLGAPATQALLGVKEGIMRTRGRWFPYATGTRDIRAMPTLHPAYLLRQPLHKRLAWRDFLAISAALAGPR